MSWVSSVWGGPFKTPSLQHPITVGWVLLKLFETIWRLFLIVAAAAAAVGAWAWYSQLNPLKSKVKIEVAQSSPDCKDPAYPVKVLLTNESNKTLGQVNFEFRLYEQGKSENVAISNHVQRHDDILEPGYWVRYCYPMPLARTGSKGPYFLAADVTYAAELSKDVPRFEPPPMVRIDTPDQAGADNADSKTK